MNKLLNSTTPASFAEEHIINSIWNGQFSPGTALPSERSLSEMIGITRTTLREVLQRLSRSGWLSIRHGKRTIANNIWETASLNVLETLINLDDCESMKLPEQLLEFRTQLSSVFYLLAMKNNSMAMSNIFAKAHALEDSASAYIDFDWQVQRECALLSQNPIYTLMLNGFKSIFFRVGYVYFDIPETRALAKTHYLDIHEIALQENAFQLNHAIWQYARESFNLWQTFEADFAV